MICDLNDPKSREYVSKSVDSFDPLVSSNYITDINFKKPVSVDNLDKSQLHNYTVHLENGQKNKKFYPSEISLQETHIEIWNSYHKQKTKNHWIAEHDAYLYPDKIDDAKKLIDSVIEVEPYYANIGLYTCFYYVNFEAIEMFKELLGPYYNFPINSGPYGLLERLFKTSMDYFIKDDEGNFGDKKYNFILPYADHKTLSFGKSPRDIHMVFNYHDPDPKNNKHKTPITQLYSHKLSTSLEHHSSKNYGPYHKIIP